MEDDFNERDTGTNLKKMERAVRDSATSISQAADRIRAAIIWLNISIVIMFVYDKFF